MTFKLIIGSETKKTLLDLSRMPQEVKRGIRRGAYLIGKELVKETRERINDKPKGGRTYKIYKGIGGRSLNRPRLHKASAPNEAPAVITGRLRKTIDFKVRGSKSLEFGAGSSQVKYARILEVGGTTGRGGRTKIKARNYLRNTTRKLSNKVKITLRREVNKLINK